MPFLLIMDGGSTSIEIIELMSQTPDLLVSVKIWEIPQIAGTQAVGQTAEMQTQEFARNKAHQYLCVISFFKRAIFMVISRMPLKWAVPGRSTGFRPRVSPNFGIITDQGSFGDFWPYTFRNIR